MSELVRHWDPKSQYLGAVLRVYAHWCLEVSFRQHALGSYILFCRRRDVRLVSDLADAELLELRTAMMDIELALRAHPTFRPDHFNYLQMGNAVPVLHFHGIPRYATPRVFAGATWVDLTFGHPPAWTKKEVNRELLSRLRAAMSEHLG